MKPVTQANIDSNRLRCNWHGMRKKPVYIIGNKCPAVRRNILRARRASLRHDREYRLLMLTMVREKLDPDKVFHHWWTNICRLTRNMIEKIFSHQGIFDIFDVEFNIFNNGDVWMERFPILWRPKWIFSFFFLRNVKDEKKSSDFFSFFSFFLYMRLREESQIFVWLKKYVLYFCLDLKFPIKRNWIVI